MSAPKQKSQLHLDHARTPEQTANMEQIAADGVCPFCPEHLAIYHEAPVVHEGEHWLVTANDYPYDYTRHHLLLIPKVHAEHLGQLPVVAGNELIEICQTYEQALGISGGALVMRFGEPSETGATIRHLHLHLIVPELEALPENEALRVKISRSGT